MTYKYEFKYTIDDTIVTIEFPADINIHTLGEHLRQFLLGCSWSEGVIDTLLKDTPEFFNNLDGN